MIDDGGAPSRAWVEDVLRRVVAEIGALSPGPHSRGLAAEADTYRRVVLRWATHPPTAAQLRALLALIVSLRAELDALTIQHAIPTRPPPGLDE